MKAEGDKPIILAFLFPHDADAAGEIEDHLVTVDTIEASTGFDFFCGLPDDIEEVVESEGTWENWQSFGTD